MVGTFISKSIEYAKPTVNANVRYGLVEKMTHQCRFINCKRHTIVMQDVGVERLNGYSLYFVIKFFISLKAVLK